MKVQRHRTAIRRYSHSRPVRSALANGLITPESSVFDYGCGHGEDIDLLKTAGIKADGWDPHHRPRVEPKAADVVNLGFVLNVIEEPNERRQTLQRAFELARRVLIVAVRVDQSVDQSFDYADGCLTSIGSFQKIYTQAEFRDYLQIELGRRPHVADLGVAYIFKDRELESSYVARRVFRPRVTQSVNVVAKFSEDPLAVKLADCVRRLGRFPLSTEFDELAQLQGRFGSSSRLERLLKAIIGSEALDATRRQKRDDILVYLAMLRLQNLRPPPLRHLPPETKADIKSFWNSYGEAAKASEQFLFSLGKSDLVRRACVESPVGKKLPTDLYVHVSAQERLPPLLRLMIFAAREVVGDLDYDVAKLSVDGRKVSLLGYPEFDGDAHPALHYSIRVYLPTASILIRSYADTDNPPVLHRKETFVDAFHPRYDEFAALSQREEQLGLLSSPEIGFRQRWSTLLNSRGLAVIGHEIRLTSERDADASRAEAAPGG